MGDKTGIEWTATQHEDGTITPGATWNPLVGCSKVSPGCANCYAEKLAHRLKAMGNPRYANDFEVTLHPDLLELPLGWKRPRKIFVNSMSDLFHESVPLEYIKRVFDVMNRASWHTFQILTKRHDRLAGIAIRRLVTWTPNIWQGVSIENDRFTERADYLRDVPAAVRFLSCEPLLTALPSLNLEGIDWVITGGESGHGFRAVNLDHLRQVRDLCIAHDVPFFLKQIGGIRPKSGGAMLDDVEWQQMPRERVTVGR